MSHGASDEGRCFYPRRIHGNILGDINSRCELVGDLGEHGNVKTTSAPVPLANMFLH